MPHQSRLEVARAIGPRVLHSAADFVLSARLLSEYGITRQSDRSGMLNGFLLQPSHLFPTEKRDV